MLKRMEDGAPTGRCRLHRRGLHERKAAMSLESSNAQCDAVLATELATATLMDADERLRRQVNDCGVPLNLWSSARIIQGERAAAVDENVKRAIGEDSGDGVALERAKPATRHRICRTAYAVGQSAWHRALRCKAAWWATRVAKARRLIIAAVTPQVVRRAAAGSGIHLCRGAAPR